MAKEEKVLMCGCWYQLTHATREINNKYKIRIVI